MVTFTMLIYASTVRAWILIVSLDLPVCAASTPAITLRFNWHIFAQNIIPRCPPYQRYLSIDLNEISLVGLMTVRSNVLGLCFKQAMHHAYDDKMECMNVLKAAKLEWIDSCIYAAILGTSQRKIMNAKRARISSEPYSEEGSRCHGSSLIPEHCRYYPRVFTLPVYLSRFLKCTIDIRCSCLLYEVTRFLPRFDACLIRKPLLSTNPELGRDIPLKNGETKIRSELTVLVAIQGKSRKYDGVAWAHLYQVRAILQLIPGGVRGGYTIDTPGVHGFGGYTSASSNTCLFAGSIAGIQLGNERRPRYIEVRWKKGARGELGEGPTFTLSKAAKGQHSIKHTEELIGSNRGMKQDGHRASNKSTGITLQKWKMLEE
ncbi:uncharacterized protein BDR25DRAFT_361868 [Lindgomyces ingoldianus]|uniref:Uncharacterized protein n=1 Tax=Lindgomyces ingoldianus TaxID=673940 RepID=A0ACB6QB22_9PLEO|nr:uncharacterized protein BDR25DRAFT_361868 [Lindgomyces ingoldianus]KAF2464133.1 hypothetical protein BDR25DRAFT_361868 [Lindgomyces ingoldianus]